LGQQPLIGLSHEAGHPQAHAELVGTATGLGGDIDPKRRLDYSQGVQISLVISGGMALKHDLTIRGKQVAEGRDRVGSLAPDFPPQRKQNSLPIGLQDDLAALNAQCNVVVAGHLDGPEAVALPAVLALVGQRVPGGARRSAHRGPDRVRPRPHVEGQGSPDLVRDGLRLTGGADGQISDVHPLGHEDREQTLLARLGVLGLQRHRRVPTLVTGGHAGVAPRQLKGDRVAGPALRRPRGLHQLDAVAKPLVDAVDQRTVLREELVRPPVDGRVAGVVLLDCLEVERPILPVPSVAGRAVVLALQNHGDRRPETLGHLRVEVGALARLDQDAIVSQGEPHLAGVLDGFVALEGEVVIRGEQRVAEVLQV